MTRWPSVPDCKSLRRTGSAMDGTSG